jgi:ribose-phosphate pyrophosphokinase
MMARQWIFAGQAHPALAREVAACADIPLGRAEIDHFPDGELCVQVKENVQGAQVFLVQPTNSSTAILKLLLLADALKRCQPRRLILVVPYFGYSRQERRTGRSPVSAEVMARLLSQSGADAVVTVELHSPLISSFFTIPHQQPSTAELFAKVVRCRAPADKEIVVIAPDEGARGQAQRLRRALGIERPIVSLSKVRLAPDRCAIRGDGASLNLENSLPILVDDMVSTGGTLVEAAQWLRDRGAGSAWACITHLVGRPENLSRRLEGSAIDRLIVTNSLPRPDLPAGTRIEVISLAPLLARVAREHFPQRPGWLQSLVPRITGRGLRPRFAR